MNHPGWPADTPIPSLLTPSEMAQIFRVSLGHFSRNRKRYARFLAKHPIGRACYSGYRVQQHLNGESTVKFGAGSRRSA